MLPLILLVALLLRMGAVVPVHAGGYSSEEQVFIFMGHAIAGSATFVDPEGGRSVRAPLYPALLALSFYLFGKSLMIPHLVGCLLGTMNVALVYALSKQIWENESAALFAAGAMALYPGMIIYSALLQSEALYIFLFLSVMLLAYRLLDAHDSILALLLGVGAGLAALARAVFLGFFPLLLASVWLLRRKGKLTGGRVVCVALLEFGLVIAPWTVRNYYIHDAFVPIATVTGGSLLVGNNPFVHGTPKLPSHFDSWVREQAAERGIEEFDSLSEVAQSAIKKDIAIDYLASDPAHGARLAMQKLFVFLVYPITHGDADVVLKGVAVATDILLLGGVVIGLMATWRHRYDLLPLYLIIFYSASVHMVMHAEGRYRLPLVPIFALFFGCGGVVVSDRGNLQVLLKTRTAKVVLAILTSMVFCLYAVTAWLFINGKV